MHLDRRELRQIGIERLRVAGHERLDLDELGFSLLEEVGRESPQDHLALREADTEDRGEVAPALEHAQAERARVGVRTAERRREQPLGVGDRVLLRDHAAHREAEQVEALEAEPVDEAREVVCHLRRRVRAWRCRRLPDAAVVVADDAVALGEGGDLRLPRLLGIGQAVHEHERLGVVAVDLVGQVEAVRVMVGMAPRRLRSVAAYAGAHE